VLPTATGVEVRSDVPDEVVRRAAEALVGAGSPS
jgi:K+-sensing histidine kinase KdpD